MVPPQPQFRSPVERSRLPRPEPDALTAVPKAVAERCRAVPLRVSGEELLVAMANPADLLAVDDLRSAAGRRVQVVPVAESVLRRLLAESYGPQTGEGRPPPTPAAPPEADGPAAGRGSVPGGRISAKDRAVFFSELHAMVDAGVGLASALETLGRTIRPARLAHITRRLRQRVAAGKSLSEAMKSFPEVFDPLTLGIVTAGETGGFLADSFQRCAAYADREFALRQKLRRELFYPKLIALSVLVVPTIPTLVLQGVGAWMGQLLREALYLVPVIVGVGVVRQAVRAAGKSSELRKKLDAVKLSLPLLGKVFRGLSLARFCRAMSALYGAGVGFVRGVPVAADAAGNAALADHLHRSLPRIEKGAPLSDILEDSRYVSPMVVQMVRTGEQTGNIDGMLTKVAEYFEQETDTAIHQMVVSLVPLSLLILGGIVAVRVISFYMRFYGGLLAP